jgi:Holliday junction resolvasome RuvABC DNA-binding subunit
MSDDKKNKKNGIEKLRIILDKKSSKKLDPKDEKYLITLKKRLDESTHKKVIIKQKVETSETETYSLKPKVTIHQRKQETKPVTSKIIIAEKSIEIKPEPVFEEVKEEKDFEEDLIEIKKVEIKEPEFLEVKPKVVKKEDKPEKKEIIYSEPAVEKDFTKSEEKNEEELTEWEPIKNEEETEQKIKEEISELKNESFIEFEKIQEQQIEPENLCPSCGNKIKKDVNFCHTCGFKINETFEEKEKESDEKETLPSFIPIEKEEKDDVDWYQKTSEETDETEVEEETVEIDTEKDKKIEVFKEIQSIDEETAIKLYDNGFPSLDALTIASSKEISKITGIKKRKAKQIKKELEEKIIQSVEPKPINVDETAEGEITEEQQENDKVEFEPSKSEWTPVEEEQEIKEESVDEEPILEEDIKEETVESEEIHLEKEKKKEAFREIQSIDEETAITLYDNGFTSIDAINLASLKDITKITGIKKRKAKQIKKEIDEKTNEIFGYKPIETQETAQVEVTEEQIQELDEELEEDIILDEEKIAVFNEIKSIDEKTAITLYDNGYNTIDTLKNATINDLSKIAGIKKRKAKQIISEIEEKIIQSADPKPINVDETAEGEITEEQIKNKTVFEEEKEDDHKVEFELSKSEWATVDEEQEFKEEKIEKNKEETSDEESIKEDGDIKKIEIFAEIESIDGETAILLYDNGFISIDLLKNATIKDLKKVKGIKKKKVKDIIFEIESRFKETKSDNPIAEEYDTEYFEEEFDEDLRKVDEKIKKYENPEIQKDEEDTEFFQEETEKDVPEIKPDEKNNSVFRNIESIDDKISTLLIENGIDSIEKLNDTPINNLTKIRGIRKKIAKQIKKEVELYTKVNTTEDEEYNNINENPYIKNEDFEIEDEWESIDKKKPVKNDKTIYGFIYNEYNLYEKEITTKSGNKRTVRFFSKGEPENAKPIDIPEGYEVEENKSGVPYLRKIKN